MANEALRWFALILVSKIRLYLTESESNGGGAGKIQLNVGGLENVSTFGQTLSFFESSRIAPDSF